MISILSRFGRNQILMDSELKAEIGKNGPIFAFILLFQKYFLKKRKKRYINGLRLLDTKRKIMCDKDLVAEVERSHIRILILLLN